VKRAFALLALAAAFATPSAAHEIAPPAAKGDGPHLAKPALPPSEDRPLTPRSFALPEPGSYELPPIAHVGDFTLLDDSGAAAKLLDLAPDQVAIVSFVYTRCSDAHGCPAALGVLQRLDRAIAADAALAPHVRLATVSFDPAHDTPPRMAELRRTMAPRSGWRFLTAAEPAAIAPVLAAFGQDALPLVGDDARALGLYRHVLKLFLVDAHGAVRNIYSSGFLSPQLLLVDARTVLQATNATLAGAPSR
jgi:cytochrome oxidase Cu insertion factor (SCO1/SenC/PrrC family)